MIFVTIAIVLYIEYDRLNLKYFLVSTAVCVLAFNATYCRIGFIVFFLCGFLSHLTKCGAIRNISV